MCRAAGRCGQHRHSRSPPPPARRQGYRLFPPVLSSFSPQTLATQLAPSMSLPFLTQRGLANAKNLLVQPISLSVLLALGGLKHDAFVASYQSWRVGLHVFSRGDSLETLEGFLAFAGENKINIKFAGVWMRSALRKHDGI